MYYFLPDVSIALVSFLIIFSYFLFHCFLDASIALIRTYRFLLDVSFVLVSFLHYVSLISYVTISYALVLKIPLFIIFPALLYFQTYLSFSLRIPPFPSFFPLFLSFWPPSCKASRPSHPFFLFSPLSSAFNGLFHCLFYYFVVSLFSLLFETSSLSEL